jgi:hypothetical protein
MDSMAQALAWTKKRPPGWNFYEFCRIEAERLLNPPEPKRIRLEAPANVSHASTWSGEQLAVGNEGFIDVLEEDAPFLISAGFKSMCSLRP